MRLGRSSALAVLFLAALAKPAAIAQYRFEGEAHWTWQVSLDGAQTWHEGTVTVPQDQEWVYFRANCSIPAGGYTRRFGFAKFDVGIAGLGGAGANDYIFAAGGIFGIGVLSGNPIGFPRIGNVLKVDDAQDVQPPGQGTGWLTTGQCPPTCIDTFRYDNPMPDIIRIAYHLDGTPGDRSVRSFHRSYAQLGWPEGFVIGIYDDEEWRRLGNAYQVLVSRIVEHPATIRVVPAPGAALGLLIGSAALCTRRRR